MTKQVVILIFDVGKTNQKIILFDENYKIVLEESIHIAEIFDEDGFPCEDVHAITEWIKNSFTRVLSDDRFDIRALNFSAHGASFVYVDGELKPVLPLYNYLKPYPLHLQNKFYNTYGGRHEFSKTTASPALGNLNSGLQLYQLKHERPESFKKINYALHLPQYLSSILTKKAYSEITSIGCHTNLWNYAHSNYHEWVAKEGILPILPLIVGSDECVQIRYDSKKLCVGIGLHDSSAALIPYLMNFHGPFVLLSTGTWSISLNPFDHSNLTKEELENDCLCYLTYQGTPVKASRLFAGHEHEQQINRLAEYYQCPMEYFTKLKFDLEDKQKFKNSPIEEVIRKANDQNGKLFSERNLNEFENREEAYCELIIDIVARQFKSTNFVLKGNEVKRIFVDGGFSKNNLYMQLLAGVFPGIKVYAASVAQASSLGAALAIHKYWNTNSISIDLIELKFYSSHGTGT